MTDRATLEAALRSPSIKSGGIVHGPGHTELDHRTWLVIKRAAEAWLETLPKPEWSVRVWANDADICTVSRFCDRGDAIEFVISVTRTPVRKVEIEAP